jgi:hypothetical protein
MAPGSRVFGRERKHETREAPHMSQRGRIRLSTMEMVLIGVLVGSLILSLLQARHDEQESRREHEH